MVNGVLIATRWLARIAALAVVGGFVFFLTAEILSPHGGTPSNWKEYLGIALLASQMVFLVVAWRREAVGALAALAGVGLFLVLFGTRYYQVSAVPAIPAALYLVDWLLRRSVQPRHVS